MLALRLSALAVLLIQDHRLQARIQVQPVVGLLIVHVARVPVRPVPLDATRGRRGGRIVAIVVIIIVVRWVR